LLDAINQSVKGKTWFSLYLQNPAGDLLLVGNASSVDSGVFSIAAGVLTEIAGSPFAPSLGASIVEGIRLSADGTKLYTGDKHPAFPIQYYVI